MRKVRENILVTRGNYPVYPADQDVFASDGSLIPVPGQLVVFDPRTLKSKKGAITVADYPRLVVGVVEDTDGDGVGDTIRSTFGDVLYGNNINTYTAEPAKCGVPEIVDVLFKCTEANEGYSINVMVEDDQTQNQYPFNRPSTYTVTAEQLSTDCATCVETGDCTALACAFVDRFNNRVVDATKTVDFKKRKAISEFAPFHVVRLYENSFVFCLAVGDGTCENCVDTAALVQITANDAGGDDAIDVTFTNAQNPNDSERTLLGQLNNIVNQINTALGNNGHATLTKGFGPCCTYQLEVNTCYADFTLIGDGDAEIVPCSETNPFDPITIANACTNCGSESDTELTFTCGLRFIAKPVDANCNNTYPPNPPKGFFGRHLKVFTEGFAKGATYTRVVQKMQLPTNQGYIWQWRDYASDNGGKGRGHNPWNDSSYGPIGLPLANDRAHSARVKCRETYCSIILEHSIPHTDMGIHGRATAARGRSVLLIPTGDSTTIGEVETLFNSYVPSGAGPAHTTVSCTTDNDQTESPRYDDLNGYIE